MVLVMSFGNKCGGRGQCRYCGQWENNVAYHEAHDCLEARRIQEAREQAYLEMLDEKKDTPKPIKSQTLNEVVSDFLGEDKHVPAPTFEKTPQDELDKIFEDFFNDKPSKPEVIRVKSLMTINCSACGNQLTKPGAILFSPPRKNGNSDIVTKFHLCHVCYELVCDVSGFNYE
jgi:hypothetical protein